MYEIYYLCNEMLTCNEILEEPLVKATTESNFQVVASEINIRCKELSLTTLRLRKNSSPGNKMKFLYFM